MPEDLHSGRTEWEVRCSTPGGIAERVAFGLRSSLFKSRFLDHTKCTCDRIACNKVLANFRNPIAPEQTLSASAHKI